MKDCNSITNVQRKQIQDQNFLQINRLEARSVLIPALKKDVYYRNKEESSLLQSLNGDYKFNYRLNDTFPDFYNTDFDDTDWNTIDVPSMWQFRGYGKCKYTNVQYPIPFDPPYVRAENPIGYYRRKFNIDKKTERTILHFGGVDNAFYVYLNGILVGFSKGSRIPSEFDVSAIAVEGENTLAVKVYTYSDATYLENQDMLLANGIFRDVYLLHLGEVSIWDYRVTSTLNSFSVAVKLTGNDFLDTKVRISVDGDTAEYKAESEINHTFFLKNPRLWNAEEPNLYMLSIELIKNGRVCEIHSKKIGIMHTRVEGNKFLVNEVPITIKGINRHEYDHKNGRAISVELIEKELRLIKANNLNAIRCSHYTNNPAFYEIASEIGLYVMDEADLETHGCEVTGDQGILSKNPDWKEAYLDRVKRMLVINKNEPCIFIWSMGNECGKGENLIECVKYAMEFDPTKVSIHDQQEFENDLISDERNKYDVLRRCGYCSVEEMDRYTKKLPMMLVEYAHAMGNSPGFLEGYMDYIYSHDNYIGGFVWEFKNHGFYAEDDNGISYHLYGGDFDDNDKYHWYNFCLDGYLTSDGTPKPTWYELGEAVAPIYVKRDGGNIILTNTNDFKNADYLTLEWELCEDYNVIRQGCLKMPAVLPHESISIDALDIDLKPENISSGAAYYLNLTFRDGQTRVSGRQLMLYTNEKKQPYKRKAGSLIFEQNENNVRVYNKSFELSITEGLINSYIVSGETLIEDPVELCFYHAPTDNDGIYPQIPWFNAEYFGRHTMEWKKSRIDTIKFYCNTVNTEEKDNAVVIKAKGKAITAHEYLGFEITVEYTVLEDGMILTKIDGVPFGNLPDVLPRIGICIPMNKDFSKTQWYGRGPKQNYRDALLASPVGLYEDCIENMNFMFDMPQETGNREENAFVSVMNSDNKGLSVIGCDRFSFSYHNFSLKDLDAAKHKNELQYSDKNYLYIDYMTRGLGSMSCGPEPEKAFELHTHAFSFSLILLPSKSETELLDLWRKDFGIHTNKAKISPKKVRRTETKINLL